MNKTLYQVTNKLLNVNTKSNLFLHFIWKIQSAINAERRTSEFNFNSTKSK